MPKTTSDTPRTQRETTPSPRTAQWTDPQWQASLNALERKAHYQSARRDQRP